MIVVLFDLVNGIHVKFVIEFDVLGRQYTNGVEVPHIHVEDVECSSYLVNLFNMERQLSELKDTFIKIYNDLCMVNHNTYPYAYQELRLLGGIYCPQRLVSLFKHFVEHRRLLIAIMNVKCVQQCGTRCSCRDVIVYNRELVRRVDQS